MTPNHVVSVLPIFPQRRIAVNISDKLKTIASKVLVAVVADPNLKAAIKHKRKVAETDE